MSELSPVIMQDHLCMNFIHITGFIISTLFSINIIQGNLHNINAIYAIPYMQSKMQLSIDNYGFAADVIY